MSITSSININLPYVAVGCCVVLLGILLYRIANILCSSLVNGLLSIQSNKIKSPLKQFAYKGLIGHALQYVVLVLNCLFKLLIVVFRVGFLVLYSLLPIVLLALTLALIQRRWSETMLVLVDVFNGPFGSTLRWLVIIPLSVIDTVGIYLIPIWNLCVFTFVQAPLQLLMWMIKGSGSSNIMAGLRCIGDAAPFFAMEVKNFVEANAVSCETSRALCTNVSFGGSLCSDIDIASAAVVCLDPVKRELVLDSTLLKFQMASGHFLSAIEVTCESLGILAKVICFPLTDPTLWKAIDRFVNSILSFIIVAPSSAIQRCKLAGGFSNRPSMCTPDFGPAFRLLAVSAETIGTAITHWIDVLYLLVFNQQDIQTVCSFDADMNAIWQDPVTNRLFGTNFTSLIRLSQTTFALSDGVSVVYVKDKAGQISRTYSPLAWPSPVNPTYGIARVILPGGVDVQDGGVGLFGCTCNDTLPTLLQCHIVTKNGNVWVLPVKWSLSSETQILTCSRLRIAVQSIRWPQQRVVASQLSSTIPITCKDSSTCLIGDVAIYAVPICGSSDGVQAMACFPEKTFTRGICFPYCMAIHMQHEGLQPLTMRGAAEWEYGVVVAKRDCVPIASLSTNEPGIKTSCSVAADSAGQYVSTNPASSNDPAARCIYDATCTTIVSNKSTMPGYSSYSSVIPYIKAASGGVRLILDGQPLVLAAGIQMRMYYSVADSAHFVDFPTLVGNQYNEFTVEANSPIGIPTVSIEGHTPRQGPEYERPGFVYPPPMYIQLNIPYNPATVSLEALWYVANPSYAWAYAMINYCASMGNRAETQIMLLSSYSPTRLWRIRYQDGSCFISSQNGNHFCAPDVATASAIDKSREIPFMTSGIVEDSTQLYDMCTSGMQYNLWVETLEDFDELNIVIGVRRGNISDIAYLMSKSQVAFGGGGKTVYYFVNKNDVSKIQESVPWKFGGGDYKNSLSSAEDVFGLLCPALRFLPDFGSVIGHSLAAVAHLFKTPVNFVLNPFAIMELLSARSLNICPENSLLHSSLNDCGMSLFSFSELFQSIYKSNHAVWDIISWLSSVIAPSSQINNNDQGPEADIFHSFLQGASVVADATKTVTLFDVVRVMEGLDTGIQKAVLGGRRRLLSVGKTFLSHAGSSVKSGHTAIFSLTKTVGLAVMGSPFAGADLGMLLASQDPTVQLIGSAVSSPPIAWAQLTYEICVPVVLDLLTAAKTGKFTFAPLWVNIYQAVGLYDELIEQRHRQACMGFRLMLGYSTSFGKGVFYNCLAGMDMAKGMLTVALVAFVDIPLYRCMCVRSAGQEYVSFVGEQCMYMIPSSRKPFWQNIMTAATILDVSTGGGVDGVCKSYLGGIESQTFTAFDPWTSNAELSAEFLANFLDEILAPTGSGQASCSNIVNNPTAIVLTPLPTSHYEVCSKTDMCRLRCADALQVFEFEFQRLKNAGYDVNVPPSSFDLSVESPMFNRYASSSFDSITTDAIVAISSKNSSLASENSNCVMRCGKKSNCLTVLIQKPEPPKWFRIQNYCVPDASMILSTVVNTGLDSFVLSDVDDLASASGLTITNVEFSLQNETTYVIMYISMYVSAFSLDQKVTQTRSHEIRLFKPDGNEGSTYEKIMSSDFLAANFLNLDMQNALFGGVVYKPEISGCYIASFVEVASEQNGKLVFFLSFSAQIKVWTLSTDDQTVSDYSQQGYTIHAIFHWCDNSIGILCTTSIAFYAPCPSVCTTPACLKTCHRGLDIVIGLSQQGNFLHIKENEYLFLPSTRLDASFSSSSATSLKAGIVVIDPFFGVSPVTAATKIGFLQASSSYLSPTLTLAPYASNIAVLGTWARSDVFSLMSTISKPIRDVRTHSIVNQTKATALPFFFQTTAGGSLSSEWLQEVRAQTGGKGWMLNVFKSQATTKTMPLTIQCSPTSCSGCTSPRLRLFCHALQDCMLKKCIGTVIQTRNILCGIGNVMQQTSTHAILTWRAMFMALSEVSLLVMRGLSGEIIMKISLKFPTEQFYTLVCSCKDMYASVVGLAVSVCQMLTSSLNGGGGLDVTGRQDVGALVGESTLKATSLAGLAFNAISGSTLLPTLALHRWIICMANSTFAQSEGESGGISIQFGDVAMDTSWLPCAQIGGLSEILNGGDIEMSLGTVAEMFVSFTLSLMSGIGETLLYGLQLSFDSSVDFLIGMVWSLQDILYTFNARECKVANNALRYVLWCSCNDTAYRIPKAKRYHQFTDGGLWCVGTLSLILSDGTNSIIYNPYTMQQLSDGVRGVTKYIECLSVSQSAGACTPSAPSTLQKLIDQGVEPIAVWAKCKSNYLQSSWDVGSGVLFMGDVDIGTEHLTQTTKKVAMAWAKSIGSDFFDCMTEPGRLQIDYSSCMRIFFDVKFHQTPNSYFIYDKIVLDGDTEPPDACLVFSGLNASASSGSPLQTMMNDCSMQEGVGNTQQCELNPLVWSGSKPKKAAAASLHGTTPPLSSTADPKVIQKLYQVVIQNLQNAFERFNSSFMEEKVSIEAALFSADGDFIHDFFDCVFLGPYTRIDVLPCDKEELLNCPFYARDDLGGKSRKFTPCFGDIMHNDHRLPFTCGSTARRSVIKYFFRNYSDAASGKTLSGNISEKIFQIVESIYKNYTNPLSMGCLDKKTGKCSLKACSFQDNGYSPCMTTTYEVPSETVSEFIIDNILVDLDHYYQFTIQNTMPWTVYYNISGDPKTNNVPFPFQWASDKASATIAENLGHFAPDIPIVSYQKEEVYTMPLHGQSANKITAGSLWGTCMALLSQAAMSIPLEKDTQMSGYGEYLPIGARNIFSDLGVDMTDLSQVELLVRNITYHASKSNSPFHWHKMRKHAPSQSKVCRKTSTRSSTHVQGRLNVGPVSVTAGTAPFIVRQNEGLSFPLFGFLQYPIGEAHDVCVCAYNHHQSTEYCVVPVESCTSFLNHSSPANSDCDFLRETCHNIQPIYNRQFADRVWNCLKSTPGVRCPELGPSDTWGLFPVDCTNIECDTASSWVGTGSADVFMEGARFLNEGRAGLRLPNYKHVNATYHNAIHYAEQSKKPSEMQQPRCFDIPDLAPSASQENDADLLDDFIKQLFPAVQLLYDSPVVAVCSRYVIEVARSEALSFVSASSAHTLQVATWKKKCESKLRHLSMCNMNGVFYDVPPPSNWQALAIENGCEISLSLPERDFKGRGQDVYLTPWCIIVDRLRKIMYDANLCAHKSRELGTTVLTDWDDVSDACALIPQPLTMITGNLPYSMLFSTDKGRIVEEDWLSDISLAFDLNSVEYQSSTQNDPSRDHVSHVLDWWPDELAAMPPGYHTTAPTDISELAPALFDSHYMYDPDSHIAHYVHTAARNGSLVFNVAGAAGICRSTTVTMPMFETNTNRVCSRTAKFSSRDTPTMPVQTPKQESGETWPYSQSFMDSNFEPELCAATEFDIPWKIKETDPQSWSAGGIPGWQEYVSMDAQGRTIYDTSSDSYPPPSYELSDMHSLKSGWGTCDVRWGAAPPCTSQRHCHEGVSSCLPLSDPNTLNLTSVQKSICYSTASFEKSIRSRMANQQIRQPCFNTFHCQDGSVCLADGGCSALYLHMWNDPSNAWPIEFTVLADSCGFKEKTHPYTQSSRGASPWEHVPDILHAHGMCSHHNWFSYRHALRTNICPIKEDIMSCDAENVNWPWVFERFDLERTKRGDAPRQSMSQGKMLLAQPHPCDDRFMHLQTPKGKRMQICSGYQGHQSLVNTNVYLSYDLSKSSATWADSVPYPGMAQNRSLDFISKWMRTYTEATGKIDIGILQNSIETDVPLGFLGANKLSDGVVGDMAFGSSKTNFFRCSDRVACSNPPFQYNGVVTERLNPDTMTLNFTEVSLRRCGAIGYIPSWSDDMCMLDIALFPLLAQILWGGENNDNHGCGALWSRQEFLTGSTANFVLLLDGNIQMVDMSSLASTPQTLFCERNLGFGGGRCAYIARLTTRLTDLNSKDSVAIITSNINNLLKSAGDVVLSAIKQKISATRVYEYINKCISMVMDRILTSQAEIQNVYGTMGPSGVYLAFKLTLYEIPLSWVHHVMLITLLSTVDKTVDAPVLNENMATGQIPLLLWDASDQTATICQNDASLNLKPALWRIICLNKHPAYTFEMGPYLKADKISSDIISKSQSDIQNNLLENSGNMEVFCFKRAGWDCSTFDKSSSSYQQCLKSQNFAHNNTACLGSPKLPGMWQDPCANPEQFTLDRMTQVSIDVLVRDMNSGPSKQLHEYFYDTKQKMLAAAEAVAIPVNYIGGLAWGDVTSSTTQLPLVRVWPVQTSVIQSVTSGFSLSTWLKQEVCLSKYDTESICVDEKTVTTVSDPCLYPVFPTQEEINRHLLNPIDSGFVEPEIVIYYAGEEESDVINVCDLLASNLPNDVCVVQYQGRKIQTANIGSGGNAIISCDIVGISVPPGIEVQAFGLRLLYDEWETLLNESLTPSSLKACSETHNANDFKSSQVASCTWKGNGLDTPIQNSWWKNGSAATGLNLNDDDNSYISYLNGFGPLHQSFDSMDTWWPSSHEHWVSNGCSSFPGVCSIRIRLENIDQMSKGVCSRASSDSPPNCQFIMGSNKMERHAIIKSSDSVNGFNLDRCGPCTKKTSQISSDGLFGCFISKDDGVSSEEILTEASIEKSVQYLRNAPMLSYMLGVDVEQHIMFNGTALDVMEYLSENVNPAVSNSLLKWGKLTSAASHQSTSCSGSSPSGCWAGFDSLHSSTSDNLIWNRAVASPSVQFTMTCKEQPYTETDFQQCNPNLDIRRSSLADFVDKRYRSKNGLWMQKVHIGMGLAWQANVAHSSVGMFSIMHSSSVRKEADVLTKWILGSGPCSSSQTVFQDRICIESTVGNGGAFQAVHPWIGGDFNPFIGFDECHGDPILSSARGPSICPCTCEPKWACEDSSGLYNYSEKMMNFEFPDALVCGGQDFPQTRIMQANDDSDVCTHARSSTLPRECLLHQGVLGGIPVSHSVTADELHGQGVPTTDADFLIQGMYDVGNNGLWYGKTTLEGATFGQSYSFLKMGRDTLHPAHIAFGLDSRKTGSPLVIKAVALLPYDDYGTAFPTVVDQWISTLDQQWKADKSIIHPLYPQLTSPVRVISSDWSCPLRTAIFWGGGDPMFSPHIPNPVLSDLLYKNAAHPLIKSRSIHENLAQYQTTNGACFYQSNVDNSQRIVIPLTDEQNQCGLKGMLITLNTDGNLPTLSKVVNHFSERCNDIMDTPNLNAELRSGEKMPSSAFSKCGVLHRLSPFLLTTRGNAGSVKKHQAGLTTRSEGGDCHMGRALLQSVQSRGTAAGRVCSLSSKNKTHAISQCPSSSLIEISSITFVRAQPIRTKDLLKKSRRMYRDEMSSSSGLGGIPAFWGPGGIKLQEAELSFGRLYAASLRRVLAEDLLRECQSQASCSPLVFDKWLGIDFYSRYKVGSLLNNTSQIPSTTTTSSSSTNLDQGIAIDQKLWNDTDWTWSFLSFDQLSASNSSTGNAESSITRKAIGTVNKEDWLQDRFGACNASYYKYAHFPGNMQTSVRSITLCEPAPTSGLQSFCTAMLQYKTDVANINCQIMGGKDCLFQPGMFYMPYMWSPTNQEFMADTVLTYYESIMKQKRFENESFTKLCPSRNSLLSMLAQISRAQAQQCPGHQIEYLKDILTSIKSIGKDILFMGYCAVMFVVNILGSAFSNSPTALAAMSQMAVKYIADFVDTATRVIMPIFNAIINILFGGSALGNLIKELLHFFCEAYNLLIKYYYVPGWCGVIRPAIYVILKSFAGLIGPFDKKTGDSINQVWITIAGSDAGLGIDDTKQCIGNLDIQLQCSPPDSLQRQDNSSEFLIQPVATRCWVDSYSGGGVLTGSSGNSYLACTSSDTCAADPLKFDSYDSKKNLIPCASCPYMPLEEMAQRFGCNTYLKRCTCGIRSQPPSDCVSNSDCRQTTICGISSDIDFAREAASTTACSVCGQMGSEPVCVMDGVESNGVCSCVSVSQGNSLQTCTQAIAGNRINLLSSIGQCLVSTNNDISSALSPSLVLEFSTLAITKCALGISNAVCLAVRLPLADGGQYARYLAVILSMATRGSGLASVMGNRRRLLSSSQQTNNVDPSTWNWSASPICNKTFSQLQTLNNRDQAKWCIHWMLAANNAKLLFNLTHMQDHDLIASNVVMNMALKNQDLLFQVIQNPDSLRFVVRQYDGLFPVILETFLGISAEAIYVVSNLARNHYNKSSISHNKTNHNLNKNIYIKGSQRRRLLQFDENIASLRMPIQTCTVLEIPLQHISAAFWDTVKYYDSNVNGVKNESMPNISFAFNNDSWLYLLPPAKEEGDNTKISNGWLADMANGIVFLTSGGTTDGDRLLDAFLSDIPYNDTVANNYITGRRILTDISSCNYTTLTFGSAHQRPLIPWLIFLLILFIMLTCLCSPSIMITFVAWVLVFPMVLFWAVYNVSPLCWPMIPPKLPHDIALELTSLVPESLEIPSYLVDQGCSVRGLLSDGTYDPRCFKQCSQEPFLMLSWQDPTAWWLCDLISVDACMFVGKYASSWEIFQDLSSSSAYYSEVIAFSSQDADFVGAHRLCAFFMSYEIVFAIFVLAMSIFVLPSIIQAIIEIFSGALVLLIYASSAELADDY